MKKEIINISDKEGVFRVTTVDERWYAKEGKDKKTGLPTYDFYPSVTYVVTYGHPAGQGLIRWYAKHGYDEAQAIAKEAALKGSVVHQACEQLVTEGVVKMDDVFFDSDTREDVSIEPDDYWKVLTYKGWLDEVKPEILAVELIVFSEDPKYAGTIDLIARIDGQVWIIDIKTGDRIYDNHILQLSAYSYADIPIKKLRISKDEWDNRKLAILRIGYTPHKGNGDKPGYLFREIPDEYEQFRNSTYPTWKWREGGKSPKQVELPLEIKLENQNEEDN